MAFRRKKRQQDEAVVAEGETQAPEHARLTPVDVQQKVFRLAFRGYNERDVDEFLDEVTESLAAMHEENKRLLEQLQDPGSGGSGGTLAAAQHQAQAIVREAREHAERISGGQAPAGSSVPSSFLVRERAFLQRIALLVQEHAGALKDEARRAREKPSRTESSQPAAGGAGPPGPSEPAGEVESSRAGDESAAAGQEGPKERSAGAEASAPGPGAAVAIEADAERRSVTIPEAGADETPSTDESPVEPDEMVAPVEPIRTRDRGEPGDATAPWRPVAGQGAPAGGGPSDDDPLVSAWESAFLDQEGEDETAQPTEARVSRPGRRPSDKDEPSLRELFWGEE
jgi:DivIVA domain-containing protein